ncbi:MAG: response regulator transcription factor [Pseudomonadota bacterium]
MSNVKNTSREDHADGRALSVLLVEDETAWRNTAARVIESLNWFCHAVAEVQSAETAAMAETFDIVILDRLLADSQDGLSLIARLHQREITPMILVVSQMASTQDRIKGLDLGADDYLAKPFDQNELRARLVALARRGGHITPYATIERDGDLEARQTARTLSWRGEVQRIPEQMFDIIWLFMSHRGEILSHERLWSEVWTDYARLEPQRNTIEVAVGRAKRTLEGLIGHTPIRSVRGQGYVWDTQN